MPPQSTIPEAYLYFRQFWGEDDCEMFAYVIDSAQKEYKQSRTDEVFDVWFDKEYTLKPHEVYHRIRFERRQYSEFIQKVWDIVGDGKPYDYPAQIIRFVEDLKNLYSKLARKKVSKSPTGNVASSDEFSWAEPG